jgi:hypothetical protein
MMRPRNSWCHFETCFLCKHKFEAGCVGAASLRLHPLMLLDAAPYGFSSCIVNTAFSLFFSLSSILQNLEKVCFLMFLFGSARIRDPDPD